MDGLLVIVRTPERAEYLVEASKETMTVVGVVAVVLFLLLLVVGTTQSAASEDNTLSGIAIMAKRRLMAVLKRLVEKWLPL